MRPTPDVAAFHLRAKRQFTLVREGESEVGPGERCGRLGTLRDKPVSGSRSESSLLGAAQAAILQRPGSAHRGDAPGRFACMFGDTPQSSSRVREPCIGSI